MDTKLAAVDDLLDALFDSPASPFRTELGGWLRDSRRFRAFVTAQRSKIRAKLRSARDAHGLADVRAELHTARLLLGDERFTLAYETYAAARQRGPDFTVTFKTHTPFNVEVRRLRPTELPNGEARDRTGPTGPTAPTGPTDHGPKLLRVLCDKLGQMPPSIVNLLWLAVEGPLDTADIDRAAAALRGRAEGKDDEFFTRQGYRSAAHFLKQYGQLSGVVWQREVQGVQGVQIGVWANPSARHKTPPEIVTAIGRLR